MSQPNVANTGTRATRVLGVATLVGMVTLVVWAFFVLPADAVQGDAARLLPLHVAVAWLAYLAFIVTALSSLLYLLPKTRSMTWDRIAGASAEVGVLFLGLLIAVGMIWGKLTWGVFWRWDPRLTTTALLFLMFIGYLALRGIDAAPAVRARRSAVLGIIAALNIPIVHKSVEWWGSLHQPPSIRSGAVTIDGAMLFGLFFAVVVFTFAYVWLLLHRNRVAQLEAAFDTQGLDRALEARRAEAAVRS